jgi:hypothetical protein
LLHIRTGVEAHPPADAARRFPMQWLLPLLALPFVPGSPQVTFTPVEQKFAAASGEYRSLWCGEGARIMAAMERVSGFPYPGGSVEVFVTNSTPMTAFGGRSMSLKASYPTYYKRATLVHEFGHRLAFTMPRTSDLDEHRLLYLFLYDVWEDLYGREYADGMAAIERQIAGRYDYAGAWDWTLAMTRAERQARLADLRGLAVATRPAAPAGSHAVPLRTSACA